MKVDRTSLRRSHLVVKLDGREIFSADGEVVFSRKSQKLRIVSRNVDQLKLSLHGKQKYSIAFPDGQEISCFLSRVKGRSGYTEFIPDRSPVIFDEGYRLTRLSFALTNFGKYHFLTSHNRRLELVANGWIVIVNPCRKTTVQFPPYLQSKQYRLTHSVQAFRSDRSEFTAEEASKFLEAFSHFLSFSHGHSVSCSFVSGVSDSGASTYEVLGSGRVSRWDEGDGWLDRIHTEDLPSAFPGFMGLYSNPNWVSTLRASLYWLSRGHIKQTGCDAALLLLQAALERLSWQIMVMDEQLVPEANFQRWSAEKKIRAALNHCRIPTAINADMIQLQVLAKCFAIPDGPAVICAIRNDLIHPKARIVGPKPYYEAYLLSRSYIDLILLQVIGYCGRYHDYTRSDRWVGQVQPVPWALT